MRQRLAHQYEWLRDTASYGPTAAAGLVANRLVLPVLDGLDELPEPRRRSVLRAVDRALLAGDSLIATCRTDEFEAALEATGVTVGAAIVEARRVEPGQAIEFLRRPAARGPRAARWQPVFDALLGARARPLSRVLSSPLMVALVRSVYADAESNPGELLDERRFPDQPSIERHLLDALAPSLLAFNEAGRLPASERRTRAWDPGQAMEWLSYLAAHLRQIETRDLAWWELRLRPTRTGRFAFDLVAGVAWGLATGILFGFLFGLLRQVGVGLWLGVITWPYGTAERVVSGWLLSSPGAGLAFAAAGGACGALVGALLAPVELLTTWGVAMSPRWLVAVPGPLRPRIPGVRRTRFDWFSSIIREPGRARLGLALPLLAVVALLALAALRGFLLDIAFGCALLAVVALARPFHVADGGMTPASTIRQDLAATGRKLAAWLSWSLVFGLVELFVFHRDLLVLGFIIGLAGAVGVVLNDGWPCYHLMRAWLAVRRRLPWHLMSFLDDMHHLGILRQVGAVYQFRHALLQDRLASSAPGPAGGRTHAAAASLR